MLFIVICEVLLCFTVELVINAAVDLCGTMLSSFLMNHVCSVLLMYG